MAMTMSNNQSIVPREPIVIRGETSKARQRRLDTGWFDKYAPESAIGIDLGAQHDPIHPTYRVWDVIFGDGDATFMEGVADESYEVVHASHLIEHLKDPVTAFKNWWRILKKGGTLVCLAPHCDMYEGKRTLPSVWNIEHAVMFHPYEAFPPDVLCLRDTFLEACQDAEILSYDVLSEGWYPPAPKQHAPGEYSIELIARKP